jgi:L-iditol 2-dehydrogenase
MGNDVVIIGSGIMGAFHIQLARLKGARVIVCEVDKGRMEIARKMGAHIVIDSSKEDPAARIKELTENRGADVVFCTVAIPEVAAQSVAMAGKLGRVVFYSSFHPDKPIEINPNRVHSAETVITGSVNPTPADFLASSRLLSFKIVDPSLLISERIPLANLAVAFEKAIVPSTYRVVVQCG